MGKSYMYKKTTVNLFQTSNISKFYIKKTYTSAGSIEIKTCPIKVMSRSEFKFLLISFWDTLDVLFIWFCIGSGRHFKDFKTIKISVHEESIKLIFNFQLLHLL